MFPVGVEADALCREHRLAGLYRIIPPGQVNRAIRDCGRRRVCARCPALFMVYFVLGMGLFRGDCYRQVFRWIGARFMGARFKLSTPGRSTLCEARQRLGVKVLVRLCRWIVELLATAETPGAFYRDLRLMAVDGFVADVPDSAANRKVFGYAQGGRTAGAFPQVRIVALCEAGTHVFWRWLIKPITTSESAMADWLLRQLPADTLLMWDRGLLSYRRVRQVIHQRAQLLARVKSDVRLDPIRHLPDGSYLAKLYRNHGDRQADRDGLVVRVLRYTLKEPRRTGYHQTHRLITTLIDHQLDPAKTLIELYHVRWEQELAIDELKTHQSAQPSMSGPMLRSQTPGGVVQELYGLLLDHYVIRKLMFEAAAQADAAQADAAQADAARADAARADAAVQTDAASLAAAPARITPRRISFVGTLKILRCRIPLCPRQRTARLQWYQALIEEIATELLPPRRNRINPRVIKRKMSRWKKKRPEHRNYPQPKQQFAKSIAMLR